MQYSLNVDNAQDMYLLGSIISETKSNPRRQLAKEGREFVVTKRSKAEIERLVRELGRRSGELRARADATSSDTYAHIFLQESAEASQLASALKSRFLNGSRASLPKSVEREAIRREKIVVHSGQLALAA